MLLPTPNILVPILWMLTDEPRHQLLALLTLHIQHLDALPLEVLLATHKGLVLAYHNARNFVQDASACAHVAG